MAKSGKKKDSVKKSKNVPPPKQSLTAPTGLKRKSSSTTITVNYDFIDLIKSPIDPHRYQLIRLPNKLRACLVSTLDHVELDQHFDRLTYCHREVEEFNKHFIQLGQNLGPDPDQMSLLSRVSNYPWQKSVDEITDCEPAADNQVSTSWEPMTKYKRMDLRPRSLAGPQCAGISICVTAGSLHDPPEFPGMAHLCEHCVFEGTHKYPNAWRVLEENCLYVNAYTGKERTVYYARVDIIDKLPLVMSVFSDMMSSPLLSNEIISKEILSVDSETSIRQSNDIIRLYDLFTSLAKSGHPIEKYHAGDASTLRKPGIFDALRKWHQQHYHGANMIVCIEGPLPVPVLLRLATEQFRDFKLFPPKDEILPLGYPFRSGKFNKVYKINPHDDLQWLIISWSMPGEYWRNHETKPLDYISFLLRKRGGGSLHKYLWNKHYITNSTCCSSTNTSSSYVRSKLFSSIALLFELTDAGFENCFEVILAVYAYLKMLKKAGPKRRIFDEIRQVRTYQFHYRGDEPFCDFRKLGETIHISDDNPAFALTSASLVTRYDPEIIIHALNWMGTETMNAMLVTKKFEDQVCQKHPNILTEFEALDFNPELIAETATVIDLLGHFYLPEPNRYVISDGCRPLRYHIGKMETDFCISYLHTSGKAALVSTHESTPAGHLPTAWYTFLFTSSSCISGSAVNHIIGNLWSDLLNEKIRSKFYNALAADFHFGTSAVDNGLFVYVHGLSRSLPELWLGILDEIMNFRVDEQTFSDWKCFHLKIYKNGSQDVLTLAHDLVLYITSTRYTLLTDLRHVLNTQIYYSDFLNYIKRFKTRLWICAQMFGCISSSQVKTVANSLAHLEYEALGADDLCKNYTYVLPRGEKCLRVKAVSLKGHTSVVINCYQAGNLTVETKLICKILAQLLSGHVFRELRTDQQLGYLVWTTYDESYGVSSIRITLQFQADRFTTGYVDEKIDQSLVSFHEKHLRTDQSVIDVLKNPVLEKITLQGSDRDGKLSLCDENQKNCSGKDKIPTSILLKSVEPSKVREFYRQLFPSEQHQLSKCSSIPPYRKLSVQIVGYKREVKSVPAAPQYELNRRKLYEGLPSAKEKVVGITPVYSGLTLDIPADVKHQNAYFLTNWFEFKNSMLLNPNNETQDSTLRSRWL